MNRGKRPYSKNQGRPQQQQKKLELRVLGTWELCTDPSVALIVDRNTYVFNVPPQSYRLSQCDKINNVQSVFVTRASAIDDLCPWLIGTRALQEINLTYCGPEAARANLPLNPALYKAEKFTVTCQQQYRDKTLTATGIPLTASMCFDVQMRQKRILFVDLTTPDDFEKLSIDMSPFNVFVHFTHPSLLGHPGYRGLFPKEADHICLVNTSPKTYRMFKSYHEARQMFGDLIPGLAQEAMDPIPGFKCVGSGRYVDLYRRAVDMRPHNAIDERFVPELPTSKTFRVTFLGTASGWPGQFRATTSILVQSGDSFVLLDAGFGCFHQLRAHYGTENTKVILQKLQGIWMSHFHKDHCVGLARLLFERRQVTEEPIPLACCPVILAEILRIEKEAYGEGFFKIVHVERVPEFSIGQFAFRSIPVEHEEGSLACVITVPSGQKLCFTGDYAYHPEVAEAIGKVDVFITEGTFMDEHADRAVSYQHLTVSQGIEMGERVGADITFVSHASLRYGDNQWFSYSSKKVIMAFDHLSLDYEDMSRYAASASEE